MRVSSTGKRLRFHAAFLSLPVVIHSSLAPAATQLHWNVGGTGGDGIWGTGPGDKNWNTTPGAPVGNVAWSDSGDEVAVFQDALGGNVTIFDPVQVVGIVQTGANYTLTAGEIILVKDASLASPFIQTNSGVLSVDSSLLGADGLVKTGAGQLVLTNDALFTGTTTVAAGSLILGGNLTSTSVTVASGAGLGVESGGLSSGAILENSGTVTFAVDEVITEYRSNGGTIGAGTGWLSAPTALLGDGSTVAGQLGAWLLTSQGNVTVTGSVTADRVSLASGTLENSGTLGDASTLLDIAGGATLVAGGTQRYAVLSTSGSGVAIWQGNLSNNAIVTPGGDGGIGTLNVSGDFANLSGSTLRIDLGTGGSDLLTVSGTAAFGGTLELGQAGAGTLPVLVPVQIVQAGSYAGNFSSIAEDLDGAVWFNPNRGEVVLVGGETGGLPVGPGNRRSTWLALYDDVIDPGVSNVIRVPGAGLEVTSGIADASNPELLWALAATVDDGGIDGQVLDRLSPAPYAGLLDHALEAGRRHELTALSAPSLVSGEPAAPPHDDGKNSSKAVLAPPTYQRWEFFAATDFFRVEADDVPADYELQGWGVTAGWRYAPAEHLRLATYFAADDGAVEGSLIDADASGWAAGLLGEVLVHRPSETRLVAGVSCGDQSYDGSRGGLSATATGWTPAAALFSDAGIAGWSGFVRVSGTAYRDGRFRVSPNAGLRYATATMDSFVESGTAVDLAVFEDRRETLVLELGVDGEMKVNDKVTATARGGLRQGVIDEPVVLGGRFVDGSRPMRAEVDGLSANSVYAGLGVIFQANESVALGFNYDAELRTEADCQHGAALSCTWRF